MIKGSKLVGRAVVDMDAAEKLGKIKEVIVQADGERVAGFVVAHAETVLGTGGTRRTIPASALNAIGPDAITVRGGAVTDQAAVELDALPRMSDVLGHKIVTQSGRVLGSIDDLLIDGNDGSIIGFAVGEGVKTKLENFFNPSTAHSVGYVRAEADLQVGNDLVVVPDDAFVEGDFEATGKETSPEAREVVSPQHHWSQERTGRAGKSRSWIRRATGGGGDDVEGWIPGDFSQALAGAPREAGAETRTAVPQERLPRVEQTRQAHRTEPATGAEIDPLASQPAPLHPGPLD